MVYDRIQLESIITILRGKQFTGALTFKEGKILFMKGNIKHASYRNETGEFVLDVIAGLPPFGTEVIQLSPTQIDLWLTWDELLHGEEELHIPSLPEIDKKSLKQLLKDNDMLYLLVQSFEGD
ncbi:MAG: hypothetical protein PVF58_19070 [Candidatus Methanofastidiosia archaeon]|jgi:hypothetical protein